MIVISNQNYSKRFHYFQNEINQVLEQTNKDTKPKITEKDKDVTDALNAKGPMQNDGQISPEASDFDVDTLFSTFDSQIASDLKELLARYEGSQENLENNAKDGFDTESEKIYSSSQSPNSSECFWEKDSINELNFSQYLQNSPTVSKSNLCDLVCGNEFTFYFSKRRFNKMVVAS